MCVQGRPVNSHMSQWMESSSALKRRKALTVLFIVKTATVSLRMQCTATSVPTMACGNHPTHQTDPTAQVSAAQVFCYFLFKYLVTYCLHCTVAYCLHPGTCPYCRYTPENWNKALCCIKPFLSLPVNRIANNGFKPFEMLFKASRCDDVDLVKSFTGEFNTKLGGMVRTCIHTHTYTLICWKSTLRHMLLFSPQLPNICSSDDVTCKLEVMSQGHCLEYNYDYENGFSIGRIYMLTIHPH